MTYFCSPGEIWDHFDPNEMSFQKFVSSKENSRKYWDLFKLIYKEFMGIELSQGHLSIAGLVIQNQAGVSNPDPIRLEDLVGYEDQKKDILRHTGQFVKGYGANNILLYGDRGTGKSSTIPDQET